MTVGANARARDIETLIHPYTNLAAFRDQGPLILESAKGIYVHDGTGRPYIDGMAGLWCTSLGYGNEELIEAAAQQMRRLSFAHIFGGKSHDPAIALAEKLKELSPAPASKVFFASSGSEANDTQIKLAWYYNNARGRPEKKTIISRKRGYHGVTLAAASLTGLPNNHRDFDLPFSFVRHLTAPQYYREALEGESEDEFNTRLAAEFEELIEREGPDTIAAFIAEPVMGAGGVIVPPDGYYAKMQAVLDKYDILYIADEVICGFGRTGNMFGSQTFGMKPDTVSMAKALTSAYAPLSAVTVSEEVYQAMLEASRKIGTFGHGYTYSGHPVAAAVGLKAIEIYERENIVGHVRKMAPAFIGGFNALLDHALVGNVRAIGLIGAAELVADKATKRAFQPQQGVGPMAAKFCEEEGLIVRAMGDAIALCPPLIITEAEIADVFARMTRALDKTEEWVGREKLRAA
jgi:4-aminobutyrate---pyruvate transaminase